MKNIFSEIGRFMNKNKSGICAFVGVVLIFLFTFYLFKLPLTYVLYPSMLSLIFLLILAVTSFVKHRKEEHELERLTMQIQMLEEQLCEEEKMTRDAKDYYAIWLHQIKTPIASMKLLLASMDSDEARTLQKNLGSIERYVDMAMTYQRLGAETTDYVFEQVVVAKLVKEQVRKFSIEFITKKLALELDIPSDAVVLTDPKWAGIIIEQLLSNAIKYTNQGSIKIAYSEESGLTITDTGIGIDETNYPRIFEHGFTGFNGRSEGHASGIGLYIAKRIADNLNVEIVCHSKVNEGTCMELHFKKELLTYM